MLGLARSLSVVWSHNEDKSPELGEWRIDVVSFEFEMDGSGVRNFSLALR